MSFLRPLILLALVLVPGVAAAQTPPPDVPEDQVQVFVCLRDALLARGFTEEELSDLFGGRIDDPERFVKERIGEDGIRAIVETCFPDSTPPPGPTAAPREDDEIVITPEQRACVTRYIDEDLLDRILRRELRPEEILSPEQLEEIGRVCFGSTSTSSPAPPPVPPTIDLPPEIIACLKDAIGETAFNEIASGRRQPTPDEYARGERCFPERTAPPGGTRIDLTPEQRQCVSGIIGADTLARIINGQVRPEDVLTPEQMRRVGETCFGGTTGGSPPPGAEPRGPPPEIVACVERVLGQARTQQLLRGGGQPTPDEIRRVEAAGCFPRGGPGGPGGGPGGGGPVPELPPEIRTCLEGLFGAERVADFLAGRAQPTQEEMNRAQACVGGARGDPTPVAPYPTPNQGQCVDQCTAYERPDGGRFTADECRRMCAGEPVPVSPPPASPHPTGGPEAPSPGLEQCVTSCRTYDGGRYNVGDYCERACRGEPVQPPDTSPRPTGEPTSPPEPTPYPTPDTAQCVASCTGYPKGDGTSYTAEECQQLCGGVRGATIERDQDVFWWAQLLQVIGL